MKDPEDINTINRPVYVVHPEYRDTVPNISLYSVLFRLPFINSDDNLSCASNSDVGRQLQLAIEFFDKVVPNQPGFSSSIAALTILPDVKRLSEAWKRWFRCAGKVRRLNFIRQRLDDLRREQKLKKRNESYQKNSNNGISVSLSQNHGNQDFIGQENGNLDPKRRATLLEVPNMPRHASTQGDLEEGVRTASLDIKEESNMEMFLDEDEIEQMTVYYREYARRLVKIYR